MELTPLIYSPNWQLSTIPDADLYREVGIRLAAKRKVKSGGRPKVMDRCKCGFRGGARELRAHKCPVGS